jgi:glutaredoxin
MPNPQLQEKVTELFRNTAKAHRAANDGGDDPEWPLWYAEQLQEPLSQALDFHFYKSRLIYCLMNADQDHEARAPDTDWSEFVAAELIEHCAPSDTAEEDRLALYYTPTCPFCIRVMRVIDRLGLDVEMRNIITDPGRRDELIEARGRATVPVLWIQSPDGEVRWMPESLDIIRYLEQMYPMAA